MMGITVKAYTNCDQSYVVWRADSRIDGCRGFALYRRLGAAGAPQPLETWVGFQSDTDPAGTTKSSTIWPV